MTILEFQKLFNTNDACREYLYKIRWPEGLVCPICGKKEFYKITKRNVYECKGCRHQVSLTAGTVMHRSHTPLMKWFWAIYMTAQDKRGISALRLQRELDVSYQTAWLMLQKIRKGMEDRDSIYKLAGAVELDESYFGGPTESGKRGRGTDKTPVQVAVSLDQQGHPLYAKMGIMKDIKSETLVDFAERNIKEGSAINSDGYSSYMKAFGESKFTHNPIKFNPKANPDHLDWLHKIVSNAKAYILGTYHGIGAKHLQAYLSEFCFRLNRRTFGGKIFDRLLNACMSTTTITYKELVHPVLT
jgi:transposase-like protein